jgi:hypothetical protein
MESSVAGSYIFMLEPVLSETPRYKPPVYSEVVTLR